MNSKADEAAKELYLDLMVEIRARAESVKAATGGKCDIPPILIREFGYLQIRMMCELIGLACLVAHGDIPATKSKRLSKEYDPASILRQLEALHPDFYPVPVTFHRREGGFEYRPRDAPFLTKAELADLYGKCGDVLHIGSLRSLLKSEPQPVSDFTDIADWTNKILNLLGSHMISRIGNEFHFCTEMSDSRRTVTVLIVAK